ncbi:hypothetical protein BGY98DRAFT_987180, partial [Russula aff. rugulosa BPL654]
MAFSLAQLAVTAVILAHTVISCHENISSWASFRRSDGTTLSLKQMPVYVVWSAMCASRLFSPS